MTPERIAELRADTDGWCGEPEGCDCTFRRITECLDEIERLREATRWRDPKVEMPPAGTEAIVAIRWADSTELAVIESCGEHGWSQSTDHRYINDNVVAWMPLPAPPET